MNLIPNGDFEAGGLDEWKVADSGRRHPQPFAVRVDQNGIEWSGWTMSEANPFRGWFAVAWEVDDWGHKHLGGLHRRILGRLCDWLDRELWK